MQATVLPALLVLACLCAVFVVCLVASCLRRPRGRLGTVCLILLRLLRPSWLLKALGLVAFALLLCPAFLSIAWFRFFSPRVRRSVRYAPGRARFLDLYLPPRHVAPPAAGFPVVIFLPGVSLSLLPSFSR